jgi:hypothetical protein
MDERKCRSKVVLAIRSGLARSYASGGNKTKRNRKASFSLVMNKSDIMLRRT